LLDEPIEHGRDAQQPHPAVRFLKLDAQNNARLVAARGQWLANPLPVVAQVCGELLHRPAISPRTALVPPHAFQGAPQIPCLDHPLHETRIVEP
jgi:hypothetical protein